MIFSLVVQKIPAIFPAIQNLLETHCSAITTSSSHIIIVMQATTINTETEDNNAAVDIADGMIEKIERESNKDVHLTENAPRKIHRHYYHTCPEKKFNLRRKPMILKKLHQLSNNLEPLLNCEIYQRFSNLPRRFRVTLPSENSDFNRTALMYLIGHGSRSVVYMSCKYTTFRTVIFVCCEYSLGT